MHVLYSTNSSKQQHSTTIWRVSRVILISTPFKIISEYQEAQRTESNKAPHRRIAVSPHCRIAASPTIAPYMEDLTTCAKTMPQNYATCVEYDILNTNLAKATSLSSAISTTILMCLQYDILAVCYENSVV